MRREISRMMKPSHYQTHVDVYVGTYMGEDDQVTLRTICVLFESTHEPAPDLRETLARISDVQRPQDDGPYGGTTTEFLSRWHPADLVREVLNLNVRSVYQIQMNLNEVLTEVEVGTREAAHKLMIITSLAGSRRRDVTHKIRCLKDATTTEDRITSWAGAAISYQLEDLWSLDLTEEHLSGLDQTIAYLAKHIPLTRWTP